MGPGDLSLNMGYPGQISHPEVVSEIETLVKGIEKIEIATATDFQDQFVNAMAIPHKTDAFPNLGEAVTLPAPKKSQAAAKRRRRR